MLLLQPKDNNVC